MQAGRPPPEQMLFARTARHTSTGLVIAPALVRMKRNGSREKRTARRSRRRRSNRKDISTRAFLWSERSRTGSAATVSRGEYNRTKTEVGVPHAARPRTEETGWTRRIGDS